MSIHLTALIIFLFDVIAIIDCVKSQTDQSKRMLWIILIIIFPVLGLILYYLLGKNKLS